MIFVFCILYFKIWDAVTRYVDIEVIMQTTGLSREEIERIGGA